MEIERIDNKAYLGVSSEDLFTWTDGFTESEAAKILLRFKEEHTDVFEYIQREFKEFCYRYVPQKIYLLIKHTLEEVYGKHFVKYFLEYHKKEEEIENLIYEVANRFILDYGYELDVNAYDQESVHHAVETTLYCNISLWKSSYNQLIERCLLLKNVLNAEEYSSLCTDVNKYLINFLGVTKTEVLNLWKN